VDPIIEELITKIESQKLRMDCLEDALLNITGFYRETADGSQQGKIRFGTPQVSATPKATV
jgi:hypothetical protein